MKRLLSAVISAAVGAVSLVSFSVNAQTEQYIPSLYFRAGENPLVSEVTENGIIIDKEILEQGDITLDMGVYIEDLNHGICYASAKWNCDSEYITSSDLIDPKADTGVSQSYTTSGGITFTTNLTPFAYGAINESGEMTVPHGIITAGIGDALYNKFGKNAFALTCQTSNIFDDEPDPFEYLGETSDEYPFAQFSAAISSSAPEGVYEFYFMTEGTGDNERSNMRYVYETGADSVRIIPEVQSFTITVRGDILLGDVDDDGTVNSSDASYILAEYANVSTGGAPKLSERQYTAGNVNTDAALDASDASSILGYYASVATGGVYSGIEEYLGK